MPPVRNPETLTKEQLKKELKKHGVKLPSHSALKVEYIDLYKSHILKKKTTAGFSSEEDEEEPVVRIARSSKKERQSERRAEPAEVRVKVERIDYSTVQTMTTRGITPSELTDEELREELQMRGMSIGPIIASTRKVYERKLDKLIKAAGTGDAKPTNGTEEYSDQDSAEDEEEEEEEEVVVDEPIQTRNRRSLLRASDKEFSSAPNLTSLRYEEKCQKPKRPTPILPKKPLPKLPNATDSAPAYSPAWVNISISDDMALNKSLPGKSRFQASEPSGGYLAGGYEAFQRGVHTDKKRQGGLRGIPAQNSFLELGSLSKSTVNVDTTTMGEMSSLRLDGPDTTTFSTLENDLENTLRNSDDVLNSTEIERSSYRTSRISHVERPLTSHLTRDLLSPNLSKSAYTRRIQQICASATRRRAMRSQAEETRPKQVNDEDQTTQDDVPTPSSGQVITPEKPERQWMPVWVAILIVVVIVAFFYLVFQAMESNQKPKLPPK